MRPRPLDRYRLEAVLTPLVIGLIAKHGFKFSHNIFWTYFKENVPGRQDDKKPNEYHTDDYGTVYRNSVTNILRDLLGAETKHESGGNVLIFDENIIPVLQRHYLNKIVVRNENEGYEDSLGKAHLGDDKPNAFSQEHSQHSQPSQFLSCPCQGCNFKNVHQETVDHHFRLRAYPNNVLL